MTFKVTIQRVADGTTISNNLNRTTATGKESMSYPPDDAGQRNLVIRASSAQILALQQYAALIGAGDNTASVETAIGVLL